MKRLMLIAFAGLTILAWRMYANDESKSVTSTTSSSTSTSNHESTPMPNVASAQESVKTDSAPAASPEPTTSKQVTSPVHTSMTPTSSMPATPPTPVAKPSKLIMTPPTQTPAPAAPKMPAGPAGAGLPPAVNFQMQMAQIHQKVFSGFDQPDLMEFGQALEQAFNGALATKEFDKGISKLEDATKDLAMAFGRNIEVNRALHLKIKKAFDTATTEFETLVRSGKIADLTGEAYLARILKAALAGLKAGFARAEIMPENTPVSANLGSADHAPQIQTPASAHLTAPAPSMPERPITGPKAPAPISTPAAPKESLPTPPTKA